MGGFSSKKKPHLQTLSASTTHNERRLKVPVISGKDNPAPYLVFSFSTGSSTVEQRIKSTAPRFLSARTAVKRYQKGSGGSWFNSSPVD